MPDGQNKSKIISFRIADDEYSKVEMLARNNGFASVAFFAREATLGSDSRESVKTPLHVEINHLRDRMETLALCIERAIDRLDLLNAERETD